MKTTPRNRMADRVREAFRKSGLSMKRLADQSGVHYASVHGFMTATRDPCLSTVDRLCNVLDLEIVARRSKKGG